MNQSITYGGVFPLVAFPPPDPATYAPTDWDGTQTISLPEFDPSLGTLTSISISFMAFIHSQGSVAASGDVTVTSYQVQEQIDLVAPGSAIKHADALVSVSPDVFSISNGTTIVSGASVTFGPTDNFYVGDGGVTGAGFASYEGTGNVVFSLLAHAVITSSVTGGSLTPSITTTALADASITYNYTVQGPPPPPPAVTVTVQTSDGIDLSWATVYDELANSPIVPVHSATRFVCMDNGQFDGNSAPIQFVFDGTDFTYSGNSPNIQLTGGTITGVQEEDASNNNVLAIYTGFSISAAAFQAALNSYTTGRANPDRSALDAIFLAYPYNVSGGNGDDKLQGGTFDDTIQGGSGDGGGGTNTVDYSSLTTPGLFAIIQGGGGTVYKGGTNGSDTLTNAQDIVDNGTGRGNGDVFEVDSSENVTGNTANFDYLIELSAGVNLAYGTNFSGISEFVSNIGSNTVSFAADTAFAYLFGATGNDTLTLGSGGGYMFGENGTNVLNGGANATNLFVGGQGGTDTMNGGTGSASNFYFVDGNDQVNGAGAFNAMIELVSGITVQLGSAQYQDVQEFVSNSGTNAVNVANTDSDFTYLYGNAGNDTLTTGSGGGYLIGEGGTNVLTGGDSINVFVADGGSGADTMNGGSGSNVYLIDANSIVNGAGTFNTVEELQQNATLTLGSAQLGSDVQQVVLNSGTNSADFHTATSSVFLYGGSGNDTLFGGTGNDFLYGGTGTNAFTFGQGWGKDSIMDWTTGSNNQIDLTALASLGVHATTDLTQTITGGNDVITSSHTGTNSITLMGVGSALTAGSFHFA